jgi:hypothetical protein
MEPVSHCVGLRVHDPGSIPSSLTGQYMQGLAPTTLAEGYIDLSSRSTKTTQFTHVLLPVLPTEPTGSLINTSLRPLVDEAALLDTLRHRRIRGAALNVFNIESLPANSLWWSED